jgi:molybdopterin-guanine dinucleotide biosynthesis protein A
LAAANRGALVCYVVADRTPQPLLSLIHRSLRPFLTEALAGGRFKVTEVLESALAILALKRGDMVDVQTAQLQYLTHSGRFAADPADPDSNRYNKNIMCDGEQSKAGLWFTNVNTGEDFLLAETFFSKQGSTK